MSVHPVLPLALLLVLAAVIVGVRAVTLSAVLAHTGDSRRIALFRWSTTTLAMVLLVVAAARPGIESPAQPQPDRDAAAVSQGANTNVFFVVDRSVDSRVSDYGGATRMSGIRTDMTAIVDTYPKARFAVIGFATAPAIDWPLSEDVWSLKAVIAGLSPYVSVTPDAALRVDAGAAANLLRYQLIQADQQYPRARNLVFYLGEGAGGSTAPQGSFSVGDRVSGGAVFGYGTATGGPIPGAYVDGAVTYLSDARSGAPVISALDESRLRGVADELGVQYVHRDPAAPVTGALPQLKPDSGSQSASLTSIPVPDRAELYWVFALLAAGLLLPEIYLTVREFWRNRASRREPR
ncbi:VWA domain-containing protein [Mycolicibacterium sp. P1-5]|uniref:VWA domain-containing protein n=1 Tax=Mycolicibacterium sp. P1-5 TaxID=2024617 RepID=UPI0011EE122E|nr:VWA domain-containing protein [Mycolicibacterium sp. P1-5]KAA0111948.1 VWA domain-containing protein [Mycolicibacterium sp. P1-5]